MNARQLLRKKRDGEELQRDEIEFFVKGMISGKVDDSQIGAMLMAMYIQGLNDSETVHLTQAMVSSGERLQWQGVMVDKHSTGGVGDKISLVLAPVLAACGLKVPMVSGRSLEYTGGTLDKLESIPGFVVDLNREVMEKALEGAGCFIAAATSRLCPADKILYRARDVTSTVDSVNLITPSIISKKVASGVDFLVVDVKVGKAAFCKTVETARVLGRQLISISSKLGVTTRVILSRMDEPLGNAVGNALEVAETVSILAGNMCSDIDRLVHVLASNLLEMTNHRGDADYLISKVIKEGAAMEHFCKMLAQQGVSEETVEKLVSGEPVLPTAKHTTELKSHSSGWVSEIDALVVGQLCLALGAGRNSGGDVIDPAMGVVLSKHVGDKVVAGEVWITVHHSSPALSPDTVRSLQAAFTVVPTAINKPDIVIEVMQ